MPVQQPQPDTSLHITYAFGQLCVAQGSFTDSVSRCCMDGTRKGLEGDDEKVDKEDGEDGDEDGEHE